MPLFFFLFFFLSLLLWLHSTVHGEKADAFSFFFLSFLINFFEFNFLI
jgi:hypothetical protein